MRQSARTANTVLVSVNPKAGRNSSLLRAEQLCSILRQKGFTAEIYTDLNRVSEQANLLFSREKLRVLIGAGGDGTAAELVNRTIPGVPISLLPSGTANLIAKYLKLPADPLRCAQMIDEGWIGALDAGRVNKRLFLVMFSAGIDADIVLKVHNTRMERLQNGAAKGAHINYLSYLRPIIESMKSYRFPDLRLESNSRAPEKVPFVIKGKWILLFNLPQYGWGVPFVPACVGTDSALDYCVFTKGGFGRQILNLFLAQLGGCHRFLPTTQLGKAFSVTVSAVNKSAVVPFQLDGDPGGVLPVRIETVPNRFTVLGPENKIRKLCGDSDSISSFAAKPEPVPDTEPCQGLEVKKNRE